MASDRVEDSAGHDDTSDPPARDAPRGHAEPGPRGQQTRRGNGLKRLAAAPITRQGLRFGVVGLANTLVGLGIVYFCLFILGWSDIPSNITGYGVGLLQSFALNRRWTFRSDVPIFSGLMRFLVVFAIAYACNLLLVLSLRPAGVPAAYAHAVGMPVYTVVFFLLSRWFVFAERLRT